MKEQQLFEALGEIDPKYVAQAQRHRGRAATGKREYRIEPERSGSPLRWLVPVACTLAVVLLVSMIPNLYGGGAVATEPRGTVGMVSVSQPEETTLVKEEDLDEAYYQVFTSAEKYWQLREAVSLSDEELGNYLWDNDYYQGVGGIQTREQLQNFIEDTQYLPMLSLPGDTLKHITIKEYDSFATFEFAGCTIEVEKRPNEEYVSRKTRGLELIWGYEGEYALYLGSENATASVSYLDLLMNANGYLVRISTATDDPNGFIEDLEQLSFQFPEADSVISPGIYGGELERFAWEFNAHTGTLTFSPLKENARVMGWMIYSEAPWYFFHEKIYSVVVEEGIVGLEPRSVTRLPNLQTVSLPESLGSIGDEVFAGCALQTLYIPAAVTDIGAGVAMENPGLHSVTVAGWQPRIGRNFLENCPALAQVELGCASGYWEQVVLPANPYLVGVKASYALEGGYDPAAVYDANGVLWSYQTETGSLTIQGTGMAGAAPAGILLVWDQVRSVVVSEGITAMAGGLAYMTGLCSVSLPSTLETLPSFFGCENLESVTVPAAVTELPSMAFHGCAKLKTVVLPDGLEKIGNMAFGGCSALDYIAIPDSVSWIGQSAFYACLSLKEIRLPENLRRLKEGTFHECVQLETVILPAGLADMEAHCFEGCTALKAIRFIGTQDQWDKIYDHCGDAIPEGVAVKVEAAPTEAQQTQKRNRFSPLWMILPIAALAVVVTEIVIGKRKK